MSASKDGIPDPIVAEFGEKAREVVRQGLDGLAHITTDHELRRHQLDA